MPALLDIKKHLTELASNDPVVDEKRRQLDHIIQECLGLTVETTIPDAEVVPGEPLKMHLTATVQSDIVPVRWVAVRYPPIKANFQLAPIWPHINHRAAIPRNASRRHAADQPYWLREDHTAGMFRVDDPHSSAGPRILRFFH